MPALVIRTLPGPQRIIRPRAATVGWGVTQMQLVDEGYRAGACKIGPAEIRARRRSGHVALLAGVVLLVALLVLRVDPAWRLLLFVPAAGSASGYLQAAMRFCANYGWRGVFNFGDRIRDTTAVPDRDAAAADRRVALRIALMSAAIGLLVAIGAVLLPVG